MSCCKTTEPAFNATDHKKVYCRRNFTWIRRILFSPLLNAFSIVFRPMHIKHSFHCYLQCSSFQCWVKYICFLYNKSQKYAFQKNSQDMVRTCSGVPFRNLLKTYNNIHSHPSMLRYWWFHGTHLHCTPHWLAIMSKVANPWHVNDRTAAEQ